jgi:nucleoside 2-deoxyribosyltransferase
MRAVSSVARKFPTSNMVSSAARKFSTSNSSKKIYLASNFGFSARTRELILPELVSTLVNLGADVHEPFEDTGEGAKTSETQGPGWAYRVAQSDVQATRDCDAIFAVMNGNPPDEGVCVELGIAIALHKPVFLFRYISTQPLPITRLL